MQPLTLDCFKKAVNPNFDFGSVKTEEYRYALAKHLNSSFSLVGKSVDSPKAQEVLKYLKENPSQYSLVYRKMIESKATVRQVSPLTVCDNLRSNGFELEANDLRSPNSEFLIGKQGCQEKEKRSVKSVFGHIQAQMIFADCMREGEEKPTDNGSSSLTNACMLAACFTSVRNGEIYSNVTESNLSDLKIAHVSYNSILSTISMMKNLIGETLFQRRVTLTGHEWSAYLYDLVWPLQQSDRIAFSAMIPNYIYDSDSARDALRLLTPAEKSLFSQNLDFDKFKIQVGSIPCRIPAVEATVPKAVTYLEASRSYRGVDEKGMSGVIAGAYIGTPMSKMSARVSNYVSIMKNVKWQQAVVKMRDINLMRHVAENFKDRKLIFETESEVKVKGLETTRYVPNKSEYVYFNFESVSHPPKPKVMDWEEYIYENERLNDLQIQKLSRDNPKLLVTFAKSLSCRSRLEGVGFFPSPMPHNMLSIVGKGDLSLIDPIQWGLQDMLKSCILANSVRNMYFAHRKPIQGVLAANNCLYLKIFPHVLAPPLKVTKRELFDLSGTDIDLAGVDFVPLDAFDVGEGGVGTEEEDEGRKTTNVASAVLGEAAVKTDLTSGLLGDIM